MDKYLCYYIYLACVSLFAVIITVADKIKAKRGKWRVMESTLLIVAAIGGSVAMYLTMLLIRHKTRHPKFMVGIPVIIVLQAAAVYAVWLLQNGNFAI